MLTNCLLVIPQDGSRATPLVAAHSSLRPLLYPNEAISDVSLVTLPGKDQSGGRLDSHYVLTFMSGQKTQLVQELVVDHNKNTYELRFFYQNDIFRDNSEVSSLKF